jgi:AraC family transcriptional regulator of adaptative response/methylated-DNA-[protein]-cysteine methyltransferase
MHDVAQERNANIMINTKLASISIEKNSQTTEYAAIQFYVGKSSLGSVLVANSDKGICAILLGGNPDTLARDLRRRFPHTHLTAGGAEFEKLVGEVVRLVENPSRSFDLPLDVRGTAFEQRVWQALRTIPAGSTASYGDIARRIGSPNSAREVGQACAANTIAVAIPCHRVIKSDGSLSGYRWGVDRKRSLLEREAVAA